MNRGNADQLVRDFAVLQGQLVRRFLDAYRPVDRERFRDVPDGTLLEAGTAWRHRRHGAGILFVSPEGVRVNAHVAMDQYPAGIDGGRLFEYLESLGATSVTFQGHEYDVTKAAMDRLMDTMTQSGLLRPVESSGRFAHRVYELAKRAI